MTTTQWKIMRPPARLTSKPVEKGIIFRIPYRFHPQEFRTHGSWSRLYHEHVQILQMNFLACVPNGSHSKVLQDIAHVCKDNDARISLKQNLKSNRALLYSLTENAVHPSRCGNHRIHIMMQENTDSR